LSFVGWSRRSPASLHRPRARLPNTGVTTAQKQLDDVDAARAVRKSL